jgi:V8-like Glu-specific endopeptidase
MFVKRAIIAARAVGQIVSATTGEGFGTGFLIAPGILITNHHVLGDRRKAQGVAVQFRYESGCDSREMPGQTFNLEPQRLFYADEHLDMAIVAVAPTSAQNTRLSEFGYLPLIGVEGKIRKGQPVNIIQHAFAGRKHVSYSEGALTALPTDNDHVAHYTGDTQPGSSGAPVFNERWEVVALHHSGVPDQSASGHYMTTDGGAWNPDADPKMRSVKWVANEGIRISRIVSHLKALPDLLTRSQDPGASLVGDLLAVCRKAEVDGAFGHLGQNACVSNAQQSPPGHLVSAFISAQPDLSALTPALTLSQRINFAIETSHPVSLNSPPME